LNNSISVMKKVFVSGCFDMLHSGHVCFLEQAARYGELYVGIGSDQTIKQLKGRYPVNTQEERKYMLSAVRHVKTAFINRGSGIMDFLEDLKELHPDVFVVNSDGNTPAKRQLCEQMGIEYQVLPRVPSANLPARSTTSLRKECQIPYRLDLAGGWLDQPFVSKLAGGPVLTISLEPNIEFNERSGMASSTRRRAIELWQTNIPDGDLEKLGRILFSYDNPPGTTLFSGSQDSLGIVMPGLNRLDYQGEYWPVKITSVHDDSYLEWLEKHLYLLTLGPRYNGFEVLEETHISREGAAALSEAADRCWTAIQQRDAKQFGLSVRKSFEAQVAMFPRMAGDEILAAIKPYENSALGWKLSGAGGGGYLVLVSDREIPGCTRINIRRNGL
jgi:cytidyltransferase-like protein